MARVKSVKKLRGTSRPYGRKHCKTILDVGEHCLRDADFGGKLDLFEPPGLANHANQFPI